MTNPIDQEMELNGQTTTEEGEKKEWEEQEENKAGANRTMAGMNGTTR